MNISLNHENLCISTKISFLVTLDKFNAGLPRYIDMTNVLERLIEEIKKKSQGD